MGAVKLAVLTRALLPKEALFAQGLKNHCDVQVDISLTTIVRNRSGFTFF